MYLNNRPSEYRTQKFQIFRARFLNLYHLSGRENRVQDHRGCRQQGYLDPGHTYQLELDADSIEQSSQVS